MTTHAAIVAINMAAIITEHTHPNLTSLINNSQWLRFIRSVTFRAGVALPAWRFQLARLAQRTLDKLELAVLGVLRSLEPPIVAEQETGDAK